LVVNKGFGIASTSLCEPLGPVLNEFTSPVLSPVDETQGAVFDPDTGMFGYNRRLRLHAFLVPALVKLNKQMAATRWLKDMCHGKERSSVTTRRR
jgi:hypothetical protein